MQIFFLLVAITTFFQFSPPFLVLLFWPKSGIRLEEPHSSVCRYTPGMWLLDADVPLVKHLCCSWKTSSISTCWWALAHHVSAVSLFCGVWIQVPERQPWRLTHSSVGDGRVSPSPCRFTSVVGPPGPEVLGLSADTTYNGVKCDRAFCDAHTCPLGARPVKSQ